MRRSMWVVVLLLVVLVVGTFGAVYSRDPLDALHAHYRTTWISFFTVTRGTHDVEIMERVSALEGVKAVDVGLVLQDYYSPTRGWKWRFANPNLIEGKNADGDYVCYGEDIGNPSTVTVTEKVARTRKQRIWWMITHRGATN